MPAVVAGSYLGGKDEVHGTQASIVHSGGRIPTLASKLGALLLFSLAVTLVVWLWGTLFGAVASAGHQEAPLLSGALGGQLMIVTSVVFLTGLLALTVSTVTDDTFSVSLIPTTLALTTLGRKTIGATVNLEVDVIAKYVERLLAAHLPDGKPTESPEGNQS